MLESDEVEFVNYLKFRTIHMKKGAIQNSTFFCSVFVPCSVIVPQNLHFEEILGTLQTLILQRFDILGNDRKL